MQINEIEDKREESHNSPEGVSPREGKVQAKEERKKTRQKTGQH
jgi:hypothetical protein